MNLRKVAAITFAIFVVAASISPRKTVASEAWEKDFYALNDEGFLGALSNEDVALAASIANSLSAQLTENIPPCGSPNPMQGVSLGNIFDKDEKDLQKLAKGIESKISPLFRNVAVNHRQTSVALYALSLIGPKASVGRNNRRALRRIGSHFNTTPVTARPTTHFGKAIL